jgi:type VI secretion system protein ImpG
MDPRLLTHYNRELQFIREMGAEFARAYPKIAGRLSLDATVGTDQCADPYVERLLEGFAFLAGRVQLQLQSEFPRFTQHLLELVYPNYLAPVPSMAVVQIQPMLADASLAGGYVVPRGISMRSTAGKSDVPSCEYRTAHDVKLWPLEISAAQYFPSAGALATTGLAQLEGVRAGLRLRLKATGSLTFDRLSLDDVDLYVQGAGDLAKRIYEQAVGNCVAVSVRYKGAQGPVFARLPGTRVRRRGFDDAEALLPSAGRAFNGYRLLQEYFAFPERFLFFSVGGLGRIVKQCTDSEIEITLLFSRSDSVLADLVNAECFALHCTPVVNLFPRRATRIHLDDRSNEFHVVADRTRPMDFEIHSVTKVEGFGNAAEPEQQFVPLYAHTDLTRSHQGLAFYTLQREPRLLSTRQRQTGPRSSYIGSEVFISLVDGLEAPYRSSLRQIEVGVLCTNRDLPIQLQGTLGRGTTDFTLDTGGPVEAVRCIVGPTRPLPSRAEGDMAWRLVSHLSLNYLSIVEGGDDRGAGALRELLALYADAQDPALQKQIEGLRGVSSRTITRRIPTPGPVTFGRGLEITLTCDEAAYEGTGTFLLGAVLEEFFARYASINSFTETVVRIEGRGEVMRWPARLGRRQAA